MRYLVALGGALALAGCVSGERVTLLAPVQEAKIANNDVGSVAVLHGGIETVVDSAYEQAMLRGERAPRLRQLDGPDPFHTELLANLPPPVVKEKFLFNTGQSQLTGEQLEMLRAVMPGYLMRPAPQIEIAAYTDVIGSEEENNALSERRAQSVAQQLRALGFAIDAEDVVGRGEYAAQGAERGLQGLEDENFRKVEVIVR